MKKYRVTYLSGNNKKIKTLMSNIEIDTEGKSYDELKELYTDIKKQIENCEKIVKVKTI